MIQNLTFYSIRGNALTVELNVCQPCAKDPVLSESKYLCQMCKLSSWAGNHTGYTMICRTCSKKYDLCQLCGKPLNNHKQLTFENLQEEAGKGDPDG